MKKKIISSKDLKEFGITIALGFPIIFGFIVPKITGHDFREWTIWIGLLFLSLSLFNPKLLNPFYKFWMSLGHFLGRINSILILALIFLFVLQPISIIMKIFGYDPLRIKEKNIKTYRVNKKKYKIDLKRIF